jgi:hypothetical protein
MKHPIENLKGKSFRWAFLLFLLMFVPIPAALNYLGFDPIVALAVLGVSGYVPFLIQAISGYTLSRTWVAEFSRLERPVRYRVFLGISLIPAAWFTFAAYSIYRGK